MVKKIVFEYDFQRSLEKRKEEVETILAKHPNKIPIIIQKSPYSKLSPPNKFKFLVPQEQTVGSFMYELRKRMNLTPEQALFLFLNSNNLIPSTGLTLLELYNIHKDEDGFLKLLFSEENTFG